MGEDGDIRRDDVLEANAGDYSVAGSIICQWVHTFKNRSEEDVSSKNLLASAETLFLALNGLEESDDSTQISSSRDEAKVFNYFLALMLERKRVLRSLPGRPGVYWHVKLKQEIRVDSVDLFNPQSLSVVQQLEQLF